MSEPKYVHSARGVFSLTVHLVFVTKYRRKVLTSEMLSGLEEVLRSILDTRRCQLLEFKGESDYVHLLVGFRPEISLSNLIGNLKATSSKMMWAKFGEALAQTYDKKVLWTGSYFASTCGEVTLERLKIYIDSQSRSS